MTLAEVIGVMHSDLIVRDAVIDYIDSKYPSLERIMIEVPYEYMEFDEPFFGDMARHYAGKIIVGDPEHWATLGLDGDEAVLLYQHNRELFLALEDVSIPTMRDYNEMREAAMGVVYQETDPEVVVVGAHHARYFKETFGNPITFFCEHPAQLARLGREALEDCITYAKAADDAVMVKRR